MGVSLQDAFGVQPAAAPVQAGDTPPPKSVGLDKAFGVSTERIAPRDPEKIDPVVGGLWGHFHDSLDSFKASFNKEAKAAYDLRAEGWRNMMAPQDESRIIPDQQLKGVGQGLLGLVQGMWAPLSAVIDEVATKPTEAVVSKIAGLVPTVDDRTPVPRSGIDWAVRQSDVQQTTKSLDSFMDTLYNVSVGFMKVPGLKAVEAGRGAMDVLTPEAKAEFQSRQPIAEAKISSAFDELAAVDPKSAKAVTDKVAQVDPRTAKFMAKRYQKFIDASEKELNQVGEESAAANIADLEGSYDKAMANLQRTQSPGALGVGQNVASKTRSPAKGGPSGYGDIREPEAPPGPEPVPKELGAGMGTPSPGRSTVKGGPSGYSSVPQGEVPEHLMAGAGKASPGKSNVKSGVSGYGDVPGANLPRSLGAGTGVSSPGQSTVRSGLSGYAVQLVEKVGGKAAEAMETAAAPLADLDAMAAKKPSGGVVLRSGLDVPAIVDAVRATRPVQILEGKLGQYYDSMIRHLNPEALGKEAKQGGAIIAKGIAGLAREDTMMTHLGEHRFRFFESLGKDKQTAFIRAFEEGKQFTDPKLREVQKQLEQGFREIAEQDRQAGGIRYEEQDHYLPHYYEDSEAARKAMALHFGPSWARPGFTKERGFKTYEQALKIGKEYEARGEKNPFKPKYSNPEMLLQMRKHASDVARMKIEILNDLETHGLAVKKIKDKPAPGPEYSSRPSPAGGSYWVKNDVAQILHNAFDSRSLWAMQGLTGDAFRGAMYLKNVKVQTQLALSGYHFLHIALGMDSSTEMVRATKELIGGKSDPVQWLSRIIKAPPGAFWTNPRAGSRLMKAYRGQLGAEQLTSYDKVAIKLAAEGGFIPEMSSQYRTKAKTNFMRSLASQSYAKAAWQLPFAMIDLLQSQMFEKWIPNLKFASYIKDAQTALKLNPELIHNDLARMQTLRKIAKSVDNRYGEMSYNTMFMDRMIKDVAVLNTLSLSWQMGLVREAGGGALDLGHSLTEGGSVASKVKSGMLDRPLMIGFYTTQALMIGGLMTWGMTGQPPKEFKDYYLPKTGGKNPDGTDARVNTMFYTKEIAAVSKHIQTQGAYEGVKDLLSSKSSGLIGLAAEAVRGVDEWGDEIRKSGDKWYNQVGQTLKALMPQFGPFTIEAIEKQRGKDFWDKVKKNPGATARSLAGFSPAPKYMTESPTNAAIDQTYNTYYAKKQTSYDRAQYSKDFRDLKELYHSDSMDEFDHKLVDMRHEYQLTTKEERKLRTQVEKSDKTKDAGQIGKFKQFSWQEQKALLDKMTPEERKEFLPHSNKQHLRYNYQPPKKPREESSDQPVRGAA